MIAKKIIESKIKKNESNLETIVSDIANKAHHNCRGNKPRLENVDLIFSSKFKNFNIIGIADRSLYHHFDDKNRKRYKKEYLETKLVYESPANSPADDFILAYAYANKYYVCSNDRFLNYSWPPRQWIDSHRICYMIIKGELILKFPDITLTKNFVESEIFKKKKSEIAKSEKKTCFLKNINESDKDSERGEISSDLEWYDNLTSHEGELDLYSKDEEAQ